MARRIVVEFLGKDTSAGSTAKAVETKFGKLGGKLDRVGQAAGKVLLGGAVLATGALYKMGQAAAADEAAAGKLAGSLRNAAGATDTQVAAVEKWITAQGRALGVTDDELRPALSRLVDATGDVGEAQRLAALAMDVSAGTGKDMTAVSTALAKAENGQVAGLARLGIATKDATGKTKTFEQIQRDLADLHEGKAAAAAETAAGKQKRMAIVMAELGESIGTIALPAMEKAAEVGIKMADWVDRNRTLVGALVVGVGGLTAVVYAVSLAMRAWLAITKAWAAITKVATAVQWALNVAMSANPIGLVIIAIIGLIAALVLAWKHSDTFRRIVTGAFDKVKGAAMFVWNWVKANWPLLLAILTGPFGIAVLVIARNWDKVKAGATAVKNWIVDKFNSLVGFVNGLPGRISKAATGMFNGIKNAFKSAINWIIRAWNGLSFTMPSIDTHIPGVGKVGGFSLGTPNIPEMARGGIVRHRPGGILARIGEGGHDEAVVPLTGPHAPKNIGGTSSAVVELKIGAHVIERVLIEMTEELGRPLRVRTLGP